MRKKNDEGAANSVRRAQTGFCSQLNGGDSPELLRINKREEEGGEGFSLHPAAVLQ